MSLKEKSSQDWINFYREDNIKHESLKHDFRKKKLILFQKIVYKELCKAVEKILLKKNIVNILSAGSGIDFIAYYLKIKFGDKIRLTILDISSECISINKKIFRDQEFIYITADLFSFNFVENYDIVYNTGLLEHFLDDEQRHIINLIYNILSENGYYITMNPYTGGKIYTRCMDYAKHIGTWEFGEEIPITSLRNYERLDFSLIEERPCCSLVQLSFLHYKHKYLFFIFYPMIFINNYISIKLLDNSFGKMIGFYGLLSIFVKRNSKV